MKRFRISVCILASMIALSVFINFRISSRCNELISLVELTEESVSADNLGTALEYAREFERKWESFHHETIFFIRGDKISEIENCYIRIVPLIEADNDELSAELAELKNMLIHTKISELPTFYNIF